MIWEFDSLWKKTKTFVKRGQVHDAENALHSFWYIQALELLARSVLAKTSPTLLADQNDPNSLFYSLNLKAKKDPKSISVTTVYVRCIVVITDFTENDAKFCSSLASIRNEDLHSGGTQLTTLKSSKWLPDYYYCCSVMLNHIGLNLDDLFGDTESKSAREIIEAREKSIKEEAYKRIRARKEDFDSLSLEMKIEMQKEGKEKMGKISMKFLIQSGESKYIECPVCKAQAYIKGKCIASTAPITEDGVLVVINSFLPVALYCETCGLALENHKLLNAIDLGDIYSVKEEIDPVDHFEIDIMDYIEPSDYGDYV